MQDVKFIEECDIYWYVFEPINGLTMILLLWACLEKTVYWVKSHWLSSKKNVLDTAVSKKGNVDILLRHEINYYNWLP